MSDLYERTATPELDRPVLVIALEGWMDAGFGGATALSTITAQTEQATIAVFDTDDLLDHRARRPTMRIDDGVVSKLSWPTTELWATTDTVGHDVVLLTGAEPDHRWRAFSAAVADLALDLDVRLVTSIGAYPAPAPHTRPTRVVATATDAGLARQVGFLPGRVEVPTGVSTAIEQRCAELGLPTIGLWAQVPHYAAAMPYPAAALALIETLGRVADVQFGSADLASESEATRMRLDELVSNSPEHLDLVRQLEVQVDAIERDELETDGIEPVSGDELAAELERFLRERDA
jgi:hypothetical protein